MAGSSWFPQNLGANLVTIPCVKLNLSRMVACLNIILPKPPFFFHGGGGSAVKYLAQTIHPSVLVSLEIGKGAITILYSTY